MDEISKDSPPLMREYRLIRGVQGLLTLDDIILNQIRELQLELSPRRNVGKTVHEFRTILMLSLQELQAEHMADADSMWTLLDLASSPVEKDGVTHHEPKVVFGFVSFQLIVGMAFKVAILFDLIVRENYRSHGVGRNLVRYCHRKFGKLRVVRAHPFHPSKHGSAIRKAFVRFGYVDSQQRWLECRILPGPD